MGKLLKLLAALLLLVAGALVAATLLIDPNDYKDDIQTRFAAATGRELVISGDLRISLLPRPALEVSQAVVPASPGFEGPALAMIDMVRFYPRLLPLFAGRFELDQIRVDGLHLQLIRDRQGRASWDVGAAQPGPMGAVMVAMLKAPEKPTASSGPFDALAAEAQPATDGLVIGGVEILDARVSWEDRETGRRLTLNDVEAFAGPILSHEPVPWRLTGSRLGGVGGADPGLRAEGSLSVEKGLQRLRLEPLVLELDGVDLGAGLAAELLLRTGLAVDLEARTYLADAATLDISASGEALSGGSIEASAEARVALDLNAESLQVSGLSIRSGTLSARGAASGQALLSNPVLTGDLTLDELDLRAWLEERGLSLPRMADAETLRRFSLAGDWRTEAGRLNLRNLVLHIDETEVKGEVWRYAASSPRYRFDLVADRLDLDRYLPPGEQSQAAPATSLRWHAPVPAHFEQQAGRAEERAPASAFFVKTAAAPGPGSEPRPTIAPVVLESIGDLDLEGRLRFGELKLARLRFGDADFEIRTEGGGLDVDNRVQRFYDGRLAGRLGLKVHGSEPRLSLAQKAEGIQTGSLLADLIGQDRVTGRGELTADLTATGHSAGALRRSLAGDLAVHITGGAVKGIDLERFAAQAESLLQGQKLSQNLPQQIDFRDLRASAKVQRGVLTNRDLIATSNHLSVTGAGTLDLVQERVDYRFECTFVKPPKGQGRGIKELEGIPIPVLLKGPLDHPGWELDLSSALSAVAERRLEDKGGDLFKKLEERTGIKGLEQGLKGLIGR